ncbi:hypothetical protein CCACVL1_29690 [Corchorus capsularis]|uniref:Uncharacterized protein n=1 Tax=Corchorus capsularis TaxID=210143 RepID=A0A1R3G0L1_COCAP|nr:hypothetical protein CCACVL1_29690 [Corchorus capsularis]
MNYTKQVKAKPFFHSLFRNQKGSQRPKILGPVKDAKATSLKE